MIIPFEVPVHCCAVHFQIYIFLAALLVFRSLKRLRNYLTGCDLFWDWEIDMKICHENVILVRILRNCSVHYMNELFVNATTCRN
jgi:hypothetical protein